MIPISRKSISSFPETLIGIGNFLKIPIAIVTTTTNIKPTIASMINNTKIIKNILKNERVCRDQNRKSTGTRLLWQQNEIPLPHNNRT